MDRKLLPKGIYTPLPTFFAENEDLDLDALRKHVVFVSQAGTIPVLAGSAGEAPHLTALERTLLVKTARAALDAAGLVSVPIVAGVGTCSTRETVQLALDAAEAGADFAMVIPPGYYAGQLQRDGSQAIREFFTDVASASPIPVIMYNFPGVSSGIDLDSSLITDVVRACPNIVGVKLTCANVGKITRITAVVNTADFRSKYPRSDPTQEFLVIDGYIDILLPSISSGSGGAISGLPNIAPRLCVRLWELASSGAAPDSDEYREAQRLQNVVALADGVAAGIGIAGLKMMVHKRFAPGINYRPHPRRPLLPMSLAQGSQVMDNAYLQQVVAEEERLSV